MTARPVNIDWDFKTSKALNLGAPSANGHAMRYDEFGANYDQMTPTGGPTFKTLTIGSAYTDTVTLNAETWSLPLTQPWTLTKTAAASTAETLMKMTVSDNTSSYFQIINGTTTNSVFAPAFEGVQSSNYTALSFFGTGTTDTGTSPLILFLARTAASGAIVTRSIAEFWNLLQPFVKMTAGYNFQLTGPSTTPTLAALAADHVSLAAIDTAGSDRNLYARNEAGNRDRLTGLGCRVSSNHNRASTTLADINGLTKNVAAGEIYAFRAVLFTTSDVAAGVKFAIGGTATATSIVADATVIDASVLKVVGTQRVQAMATTFGNVTAVTNAEVTIQGHIVVNAAGTLTIQFAQNVANANSTVVLLGSHFHLISIGL